MTDKTEGLEAVAEVTCEDMGKPFNAMQIRVHFTKEVPPVGTQLVALTSAQAVVAQLEGEMADQGPYINKLRDRITQLEAALVVAREALQHASKESFRHRLNQQKVYGEVEICNAIAAIDSLPK